RSDSDMHTLGYRFRPWSGQQAIADGPAILDYIRDTARESGIDNNIRYGHRVVGAAWSSDTACWTVEAICHGETVVLTANFLYVCSGYYHYDSGYSPDLPATERFDGTIVHPQHWPEEMDHRGKRVVVIGSGATSVTLVPALADEATHVTLLQRSPTYIVSLPSRDGLAEILRRTLGNRWAGWLVRWKNVAMLSLTYRLSRRFPRMVRAAIRRATIRQLPPEYPVDTHFNPHYRPWDQRLCVAPDGDLFAAIRHGDASVVTDHIEEFTSGGIQLSSGQELRADIVVTATGLRMLPLGGMQLTVDGQRIELPRTMAYKGMMLSDVPNFAFTVGYDNAYWTLKADLVAEYVVRVLRHIDAAGYGKWEPVNDDPSITEQPLSEFDAGSIKRSIHEFPRAGSRRPWRLGMNYLQDLLSLRYGRIDDGALRFSGDRARRRRREDVVST